MGLAKAVISPFEGLLATTKVHLEQEALVWEALAWHHGGVDFADAPHLAGSEDCGALLSLDRQLAQLEAQLNLQPLVQNISLSHAMSLTLQGLTPALD